MPDFSQFSADMCNEFANQFLKSITSALIKNNLKDYIEKYKIKSEKLTKCLKCKSTTNE